jgi:hypothetical protein
MLSTSNFALPNHFLCQLCGHYVEGKQTLIDGLLHCPNCAEFVGYQYCEDCNTWYHADDMQTDDRCRVCGEDYSPCDTCGAWLLPAETYQGYSTGDTYCESCYHDRFTACDACGAMLDRDDTFHDERGDQSLCESCYQNCVLGGDNFDARSMRIDPTGPQCFGVEIETDRCNNYEDLDGGYWGAKDDGSINGKEFVSCVLQGQEGFKAIDTIGKFARNNGWDADNACGLHIHLDARNVPDETLYAVCRNYYHLEGVFRQIVARHRCGNTYCKAVDFSNLPDDCRTFRQFAGSVLSRFRWVNVSAYLDHQTIEIRNHHGTVSAKEIKAWVALHLEFWVWTTKGGRVPSGLTLQEQWATFCEACPTTAEFYLAIFQDNSGIVVDNHVFCGMLSL